MASSVRCRSPAADFSSSFTSSSVLMFSLSLLTTDASLSAMRLSLSRECNGSERLRRAKEWCSSLNSVTNGSDKPFGNRASIIDSIARPAEEDELSASATNKRMSKRPELLQRKRYDARVAGDSIVDTTLSMSCLSRFRRVSGETT
eukprot:1586582-Pleurochrysis_carterae.AAC.1